MKFMATVVIGGLLGMYGVPGRAQSAEPPLSAQAARPQRIAAPPGTPVVPAQQSIAPPAQIAGEAVRLGMTWGVNIPAKRRRNVVFVSCHGVPKTASGSCDAYVGDTDCRTRLPVLCLYPDGRARPPGLAVPVTNGAMADPFYAGWAGGELALSAAVRGASLRSQGDADAFCARSFGAGWRMAEFHDGLVTQPDGSVQRGGWAYYAAGSLSPASRFWVAQNDQPANCWSSRAPPP